MGATRTTVQPAAVSLSLRGISVQLLLQGVEALQVRAYELGYKSYALPQADTWLVETLGPAGQPSRRALVEGFDVGSRPAAARIVGGDQVHASLKLREGQPRVKLGLPGCILGGGG